MYDGEQQKYSDKFNNNFNISIPLIRNNYFCKFVLNLFITHLCL